MWSLREAFASRFLLFRPETLRNTMAPMVAAKDIESKREGPKIRSIMEAAKTRAAAKLGKI